MNSVADYAAFLWIPLVTTVGAVATILFVVWLVLRYIKDSEARAKIKSARFVLIALVIAGFAFSAFQTAAVHLPRSTIDRSLSDEQQQALERRVYEEGEEN